MQIKQCKQLLKEARNPVFIKQLQQDLKSFQAIKDLIDRYKDR